MCGICGTVHFHDPPVTLDELGRACAALRHRGPDHAGYWLDEASGGAVGFAAVRLAVIDPSPASHQPMHHPGGRYHLVFNGEVYNFRSLRQELEEVGERFTTDGDTEVVLAACVRWGTDACRRFNGMWALAFYDSQTRNGFLSRDRFGIKPLFYGVSGRGFGFASELRALHCVIELDRTIDPTALIQHVQFGYIAQPATIYRRARRLEPGHLLPFHASAVANPVRYYDPLKPHQSLGGDRSLAGRAKNRSDQRTISSSVRAQAREPATPPADSQSPLYYADSCTRLSRLLSDAVTTRRVCDVPIGAFLSGGLDSSIVAYHLAAATGRRITTFAIGFADQQRYDETRYARLVADRLGTEHHEWILTQADILEAIPRVLDHLDEPIGDSSIIPTALVAKLARRHVTVALSGDGSDELFGGYWRYLGHDVLRTYSRLPAMVRRLIVEPILRRLAAAKSTLLGNRIRQFRKLVRTHSHDAFARHLAWSRILSPEAEALWTDREAAAELDRQTIDLWQRRSAGLAQADDIQRILAFDLQYPLPADMLHKVDVAGMMHSLEVRLPFLDPAVVAFALSLPSRFKIDRGRRKRILVDAYRGRLPDEVLDRPKQGFEVPIGELLRGPLRELFRDTVTRERVESFGLLSYEGVERLLDDHLARRGEYADVLFALLSLCWWKGRERPCG